MQMKKCSLFIIVLGMSRLCCFGQPNVQWQRSLGGINDDEANCMVQTSDGGYVIAGSSYSNDGDVSGHHGANTTSDFWVVKINSTGTIQWQKSLGGSNDDIAYSIIQTTDGGYAIAGSTVSMDGDVTFNHGNLDYEDYWVVKLDSSGVMQWQKTYGGSQSDDAHAIVQTADGGYAIAGYSMSDDGDVTGHHGIAGYSDYWIVKTDATGTIQWEKSYGGSNSELAIAMIKTDDGGFALTGYSFSTDGDVTGHHGDSLQADYWVLKLDNSGIIKWETSLGGSLEDVAYSIIQTLDGGYAVAGESFSNDGDVTGNHGENDYWVAKLNSVGTLQWQKSLGGSSYEYGRTIAQNMDGSYIVAGDEI